MRLTHLILRTKNISSKCEFKATHYEIKSIGAARVVVHAKTSEFNTRQIPKKDIGKISYDMNRSGSVSAVWCFENELSITKAKLKEGMLEQLAIILDDMDQIRADYKTQSIKLIKGDVPTQETAL